MQYATTPPDVQVPAEPLATVGSFLLGAARRWPDRAWCTTPAGTVTRAEAIDRARRVAGGLQAAGLSGWHDKYGSMGRPRQHPRHGSINAARLMTSAGKPVTDGEIGELELWTATPTPGYLNMPAETEALFHDGWLRTGDLAYRDADGFYFFAGRIKEIIRHRGENLSPVEVEQAINAHPDVIASAVIGVPSEMTEKDVKAFVIAEPGADLDAVALQAWCVDRLPPYKRPRFYEFVDELPLTQTNKVAKHKLTKDRSPNEVDVGSLT